MDWTRGRPLGRGSTATVSAATCLNSGEVFAVKSAELSGSEFLQREARILSSLSSRFIIGYRGCEITKEPNEETLYNLLMEYAPNGTLTDATVRNGGKLEENLIVRYTSQMVLGLVYLHANGIAHCDIKGRNVLIGENGEAKIADFGCAKRIEPEPDTADPISGTPAFMAPEVALGEHQGSQSDIWAVGCTVIEMATGSPPWTNADSSDPVSVLYRVGYSGESPEFPCVLSQEAKDFLEKCLRRDPRERWTAGQLLNHPFLAKLNSQMEKQIQESIPISISISDSPTSVIDQEFWNCVEEDEEPEDLGRSSSSRGPGDRIGPLCSISSGGPTWGMDAGDWIIVREGRNGTIK